MRAGKAEDGLEASRLLAAAAPAMAFNRPHYRIASRGGGVKERKRHDKNHGTLRGIFRAAISP